MKVSIQGIIKTTRPLHCASTLKSGMRFDYTTGGITFGPVGMPMTGTVTKGILRTGSDRPDMVPYFPSNDIRGRLRRLATGIVLEAIAARDEQVGIDTFDGMNAGNFKGQPDSVGSTLTEMKEFREHFFMGLFGGGPRTLPSKLITHDLDPIYDGTIDSGSIPAAFEAYAYSGSARDMTEVIGCVRRDDTTSLVNLSMMRYIEDAFDAINDRQDQVSKARSTRKKQKATAKGGDKKQRTGSEEIVKKDDLANMFAYECIRAGLPMYLELGFSGTPTDAQIGLLLEALVMLFNRNQLGGRIALGMGNFDGHANLVVDRQNLGTVLERADAGDGAANGFVLTKVADRYMDALELALESTSAEDLNRFFRYGAPATPIKPESPESE
jgi:CRISPR type IV-associated protein Csf2